MHARINVIGLTLHYVQERNFTEKTRGAEAPIFFP